MAEDGTTNGAATRTPDAARVEEVVNRSLAHTREWLNRKRLAPEVLAPAPRLGTREWLVRASFALFAVTVMGVVVFSALGLLSANEAVVALTPVATLTAAIVGVYLGDRTSD